MERAVYIQLDQLAVDPRGDDHPYVDYSTLYQPADAYEESYLWTDVWKAVLGGDQDLNPELATATAYRRTLRTAVARLDLLGYTLAQVRAMYEDERQRPVTPLSEQFKLPPRPPFDVIAEAVAGIDVPNFAVDHPRQGPSSPWGQAAAGIVWRPPSGSGNGQFTQFVSFEEHCQHVITGLDTFTLLQLLAKNPVNLDLPVIWHPFYEDGYEQASADKIEVGAKRQDRFLIVTEGSSDTAVIRKALRLLRPHVLDFFDFVDMEKNYPLTGVGNLHNFYQGLLKIGILNNVLFVYDNDAEGSAKFVAGAQLAAPPNVRIMKLPELEPFRSFPTVGPTGEQPADINGKAVSIECFLDLHWCNDRAPRVRWTSYHAGSGQYQGELEGKQTYLRRFLELAPSDLANYDAHKLDVVLDAILSECTDLATARVFEEWSAHYS